MSTISGIVIFIAGRKMRSTALPIHASSMRRLAHDRRRVDRILAMRDARDVKHRILVRHACRSRCDRRTALRCATRLARHSLPARSPHSPELPDRPSRTSPISTGLPRRNPAIMNSSTSGGAGTIGRKRQSPDRCRWPPQPPVAIHSDSPLPLCGNAADRPLRNMTAPPADSAMAATLRRPRFASRRRRADLKRFDSVGRHSFAAASASPSSARRRPACDTCRCCASRSADRAYARKAG